MAPLLVRVRFVRSSIAWSRRSLNGAIADGYFDSPEAADVFEAELTWLLAHQRVAFNSPVWFNIGVEGVPQQASACFILSVDDDMDSILDWYVTEGRIFKGGSGAGVNLSAIRASCELLSGGGEASGPVSFMRGADASAGTIRSGGKTRRAAKMVLLDADHPDIEAFVWCKAREERKARALASSGFDIGPRRRRFVLSAVPERQQLGPPVRRVHDCGRGGLDLEAARSHDRGGDL